MLHVENVPVDYQVERANSVASCGVTVTHNCHIFLLTTNMRFLSICMEWTVAESLLDL